jgi:signal transduction histidine kinase
MMSKSVNNNLTKRISILLLGAVGLTVFTVVTVIFWMSFEHNKKSAQDSKTMINGGLLAMERSLQQITVDYAWWDDAVKYLKADNSEWIYSNLGTGVTESKTVDLMFFVPEVGEIKYGWALGDGKTPNTSHLNKSTIESLNNALPHGEIETITAVSRYAVIGDEIYLLAAAHIAPDNLKGLNANDLDHAILGFKLSEERIAELGATFLNDSLLLSASPKPDLQNIPIKNASGDVISYLTWQPAKPGAELIKKSAIPVTLALGLFALLGFAATKNATSIALALTGEIAKSKALASEANELMLMAQKSDRAKTEFLANISHEIRTPMNGVIGMSEVLFKTELNTSQAVFVNAIKTSGNALLRIINDILDFSKIEANKIGLKLEPVSLATCIHEVNLLLSHVAGEKSIRVHERIQSGFPEILIADGGRIRQILLNLLGNALKFSDGGDVFVDLRGEPSGEFVNVAISVQDSGIGIPEEELSRIFVEFNQVDDSITKKYEGTGLGLSLSLKLAQLMEGNISVRSQVGVGSVFTLLVPLRVAADVPKQMPTSVEPHSENSLEIISSSPPIRNVA